MQTLEYRTVDKSTWGPGPWQDEPDKKQWQDPATGLPCLIVRGPVGALCGYVGVAMDHPWFRNQYDHAALDNLEVHGGLTFASLCSPGPENRTICHVPGEGEPDHVWWFGFDCAHSGDFTPKPLTSWGGDIYRDLAYVEDQVTQLAEQINAAK